MQLVTDPLFVEILAYVWKYAILGTVIIVGMGVTLKRNIIFFILFCAIAAVAVVFSFPRCGTAILKITRL